jgi:hypothetical protein
MSDAARISSLRASPGARVSPPAASYDGDGVLDLRSRLDYSTLLRVGTPAFRNPDRGRPRPQQATRTTGLLDVYERVDRSTLLRVGTPAVRGRKFSSAISA